MNEMVFVTYIIALVALAVAAYALLEINHLKKEKPVDKKTRQTIKSIQQSRSKGHWD